MSRIGHPHLVVRDLVQAGLAIEVLLNTTPS